ncbi:hypothetical protein ASG87_17740 [Frateuria sp. Soil773]|uniref:hypothetical protein n=1 Tax=Frateuria sp. Soil773 TaxID=1736407 RepID=UPI0006F3F916|nr:hypothetical protein [Frateuria sp. Soil773]KRE94446.1 hypothetical protein ASG87_17740 [Frateuria sp. Soil773]
MSTNQFPLEPLRHVRDIRLRALESALQRCRARHDEAERQRAAAQAQLEQAQADRQSFATSSWRDLFDDGVPTALAMARYERHLALLDHGIGASRLVLAERERECAEAAAELEAAAAAWRQARRKLDAVGELKQGWLREARNRIEWREEQSLEELLLHQAPAR